MLDHRLKEPVENGKNRKIKQQIIDAKSLESSSTTPTPKSQLPPVVNSQPRKNSFFREVQKKWNNLSFRTKLTLLLAGSAALPTIAVTQALINFNNKQALQQLENTLQLQGTAFAGEYVQWTQIDTQSQTENIAKILQAAGINLSNPAQVAARRNFLQDYLIINENNENPELTKHFKIVTDTQGRTVAQNIIVLDEDFSKYPPLPKLDKELPLQKYRKVSLPIGISLTDIPIVKNALQTGQPLSGIELVKSESLQRLGLEKPANIGIRKQHSDNLAEAKKPFPEGTYDVDGGKAGLVSMAVHPVKINNKIVGTVVMGTLLNRNYGLVDKFAQNYDVPVATVFAKDWRVVTNVPYTDGKTRALGTRVSREVATKVLNQGQDYIGNANIVGSSYLTYYTPIYDHQKELNPNLAKPVGMAFVGESLAQVESGLAQQRWLAYGIGGSLLALIGALAIPLAGSFSRPLRRLSGFAHQVAAGNQGVRLEATERSDEIGVLSREMNAMAVSIDANQEQLRQEAERVKLFADVASSRVRGSQDLQSVFDKAVTGAREILQADRVIVYRFNPDWSAYITGESVVPGLPQALANQLQDPGEELKEAYQNRRVVAINNVSESKFSPEHRKLLELLQVKAKVMIPIVSNDQVFGLLVAQYCNSPHNWQQSEIDFLKQLATQVGLALNRVHLLQQQIEAKELLQRRALELLMEVDPLSKGDLTIRASVTEDEIGTIADSYNATISSLRQIVSQVQLAASQLATTTKNNEGSIGELSTEALRQAEEIDAAVAQIQAMANSMRAIATNAEQAEVAVQQASHTVQEGDQAMNRTVDGILAIRETVAQTSKKVKRLGESSQKISKVVNLISTFADQTNLLALNAAIEAANAGEQGRGFAVVAERVRSLARQSTEATAEIEKLVTEIQTETNEVVAAMEAGTEQVVTGTKLVDETRTSLNRIADTSNQINALVKEIATAAVVQNQASSAVTQTMSDVAAIANKTSTEATQVSDSFKELLSVAQQLQASASQFKVN